MKLSERQIGEYHIIDIPKDIFNRQNVDSLKIFLNTLIEKGADKILLNFSRVPRIDGIGLGVLLSLQKIAVFNDVTISLYGLQSQVFQVFQQTRMNKILKVFQNEEDIIKPTDSNIRIA